MQRYVEPLLTDEEKRIKKCEPRPSRGNRKWNANKVVTVPKNVQQEYVPTLRERMMERDKQQGIVREPDFGGMKLEHHEYCLRGSFAQYKIDLVGKKVTLDSEAGLASFFAGALVADDIPILIRELQTLQGLMN